MKNENDSQIINTEDINQILTREEIKFVFAEYLSEDVTSGGYWKHQDVLMSFRKVGDDIYTYWGGLKDVVLLYSDQIFGKIYFEKNIESE